jgi:hypothetical protein
MSNVDFFITYFVKLEFLENESLMLFPITYRDLFIVSKKVRDEENKIEIVLA